MTFVPKFGDVYVTAGLAVVDSIWDGEILEDQKQCYSLRLSPNGTSKLKMLPDVWGVDSHQSVHFGDFAYLIGGFNHYSDATDTLHCGYDANYKYAHTSSDFYRIDTTGTNSSVDWDWKFLPFRLALTCAVVVEERFIYVTGGFQNFSMYFN